MAYNAAASFQPVVTQPMDYGQVVRDTAVGQTAQTRNAAVKQSMDEVERANQVKRLIGSGRMDEARRLAPSAVAEYERGQMANKAATRQLESADMLSVGRLSDMFLQAEDTAPGSGIQVLNYGPNRDLLNRLGLTDPNEDLSKRPIEELIARARVIKQQVSPLMPGTDPALAEEARQFDAGRYDDSVENKEDARRWEAEGWTQQTVTAPDGSSSTQWVNPRLGGGQTAPGGPPGGVGVGSGAGGVPQQVVGPGQQGPVVNSTPSRIQQGRIDIAEASFLGAEQAVQDFTAERGKMEDYIFRLGRDAAGEGGDFNLGPIEKHQSGWMNPLNEETQNNTREIEMFVQENVLGKMKQITGALSEKELAFLQASVPNLGDGEKAWIKYLARGVLTVEALGMVNEDKRKWVESGKQLVDFDDRTAMDGYKRVINANLEGLVADAMAPGQTRESLSFDLNQLLLEDM